MLQSKINFLIVGKKNRRKEKFIEKSAKRVSFAVRKRVSFTVRKRVPLRKGVL